MKPRRNKPLTPGQHPSLADHIASVDGRILPHLRRRVRTPRPAWVVRFVNEKYGRRR